MMVNPAVPARIRRLLNVESGLNDGIATPFVLVAVAGAPTAEHAHAVGPGKAIAELAVGLAVGVAVGAPGAGWSARRAAADGRLKVSRDPRCWDLPSAPMRPR
jgi:NhaP-type Na+/H+ or K+/H+ antiporter